MDCPKCYHHNPPGLKYCNQCGADLIQACPNCGFENAPGSRYCGECRHDLYQSSHNSEPIPVSVARSSGERRQATVLFSDLSGFTAMTERLDPEEVEAIMWRLKDGAVKIVEAHGGIVSQFVGDEVLALFGIPHRPRG